ncbi:MAG: RNA polymerase subunit sigma [Deltaproteobacteria bacterium RBG_13_49_15]|nr:MAG: RNA polymerase subunit sigma [Deltaproteobacteria bacterium RBG_13_49_15]
MDKIIRQAVEDLAKSKKAIALTGAGISVESNIPPFRGKGGIWEKFDPMEYAHIDAFLKDPVKVWNALLKDMKEIIDNARPNDGHLGLARLEQMGILKTVITQNVDGLHQMAGNTDVIEFHGNFAWHYCMECNNRIKTKDVDLSDIPPRCACGGIYRPECVFFGEMIPPLNLMRSRQVSSTCDLMLVIGTSAIVQPAALMPIIAKQSGAKVIEINPEQTPLTGSVSDYIITSKAGEAINRIMAELQTLL